MPTAQKKPRRNKFRKDLTSRRFVSFFALLLLPCVNTTCFGQTVRIRLVNVANLRPVKKQTIAVSGIIGKEETRREADRKLLTKPLTPDLRVVTDAEGEAQFELPKPAPAHFYVRAELSGPVWDCPCLASVSTEDVDAERARGQIGSG